MQKWNHDKCWCDCKELRACDSCIDDYIWNPTMWDREWNKACKTTEHLNIGNCSREERLLDKLVLICEDEILIITETSLNKKVTCERNYCLIHTISLATICTLLLIFACSGCYYYYTRYWKKNKKNYYHIKTLITNLKKNNIHNKI